MVPWFQRDANEKTTILKGPLKNDTPTWRILPLGGVILMPHRGFPCGGAGKNGGSPSRKKTGPVLCEMASAPGKWETKQQPSDGLWLGPRVLVSPASPPALAGPVSALQISPGWAKKSPTSWRLFFWAPVCGLDWWLFLDLNVLWAS